MTFDAWWGQKDPYIPHLVDGFEDHVSEWKVKKLMEEA